MATRSSGEGPARLQMALAALPAASQPMRDELARWLTMVTPPQGDDICYGASTDAAMVTTTWRVSAAAERIRPGMDAYFADFGVGDDEPARLDATLEMLGPQRAGIWIEMGDNAIDTGWWFDEPFPITKVFAVAGARSALADKTLVWAERHGATRTAYLARSLGANKPYHDVFIPVGSVDAALELVESYDLAAPNVLVDDALRRGSAAGAGVSVRLTETGVSRVGVLARRPSTDAVLSLIATRDQRDARLLAVFEGALGVDGAAWAEYEIFAGRTNVELHFTLE